MEEAHTGSCWGGGLESLKPDGNLEGRRGKTGTLHVWPPGMNGGNDACFKGAAAKGRLRQNKEKEEAGLALSVWL